jgi:hypothetical protein
MSMDMDTVGRVVRVASPRTSRTSHILVTKESIDEYVIEALKSKEEGHRESERKTSPPTGLGV